MADEKQLKILKEKGVEAWNKWRENNPDVEIDLSGANLIQVHLSDANLSNANLGGADLYRAILKNADLLSAILFDADCYHANLIGADLGDAYLDGANLRSANLKGAKLSGAYLYRVQALATNFSNATLTGACIKDWNINSETNFENVICDYIYLKAEEQERRPSDPNRNFEPGEFAKLIEHSIHTVDLVFKKGIEWKAFLLSFQDLQVEHGEQNVSIQAIEQKSDGAFIIRLSAPPEADKAEIESYAKQSYETNLKLLEVQYRAELKAKDREIEIYKQKSADILELAKLAANRPINVSQVQGDRINLF